MDTSKYSSFFKNQIKKEPLIDICSRLNFTEKEQAALTTLFPLAQKAMGNVIVDLYKHILALPNSEVFFPTQSLIEDMKQRNHTQTLRMFQGPWDEDYFLFRMHIGAVHVLVNLPPLLYISSLFKLKKALIHHIGLAKGGSLTDLEIQAIESICQVELYLTLNTYFLIHQNHIEEARQQTAEILDNLSEAFFEVNPDLQVGPVCSAACVPILGHNPSHMPVTQAIPSSKRTLEGLQVLLEQVFQNFLPVEVSLSMLPEKVLTRDGRTLQFRYTPVVDDNGDPQKIICAVSDVTGFEAKKRELEKESQHKNTLLTILRFRPSFLNFVQDAHRDLAQFNLGMGTQEAKRILHTLKGSGASYGLTDWAQRIHVLEDTLESNPPLGPIAQELTETLNQFLEQNHDILGISFQEKAPPSIEVPVEQLAELDALALDVGDPALKTKLQEFSRSLRKKPISQFLGPYATLVEQLSARLGKKIKWEVEGGKLRVMPSAVGGFFQNIVHAIRNAADHGIESPEDRVQAGKEEWGTIRLLCEAAPGDPTTLAIAIEDDGRGLNTEKLREKALSKGLATAPELATWSQEQVWALIFADDISTAEQVSDVSGRGVGLAALLKEVQNHGGAVAINTTPGHGTRITFCLPGAL